jgi:polyisoprenyl-teichoic acid--peptidoglycan teichoic acid transferase
MSYQLNYSPKGKKWKSWKKTLLILFLVFLVALIAVGWKTGFLLNKISTSGGLLSSIIHALPGVDETLEGEKEGRINVILLGMRGANVDGGGLLTDTIMIASIAPEQNKIALVSIPRDLYVTLPSRESQGKINSVYAYGEERGRGKGLEDIKEVLEEITGQEMHYAASINFEGFKKLVDALGGIEIYLGQSFSEPVQFQEEHVCDPYVFTVPTGNYEIKKNEKGKIVARYPLCRNSQLECGGNFQLPAGNNVLDGETALCFVRSRSTSNDFERAKRQQLVLQKIKDKSLSTGTLTDFGKISGILEALGNNVLTDMRLWEMRRLYEIYGKLDNPQIKQNVLENSEEGMLYSPPMTEASGYILLPRGNNFDRIKEMFANIFND